MLFLKILIIIILLLISYQDFRYQAVSWLFFPAGFIMAIFINLKLTVWTDSLISMSVNSLFILFQLSVIYIFSWIKYKQRKNIFKSVFGLGDLLFLVMIIPLFSPFIFVVFFIGSVLFALLTYFFIRGIRIYKGEKVPLAGLQSLFLIIIILIQFFSKFSLYNDDQLLQYFIRW